MSFVDYRICYFSFSVSCHVLMALRKQTMWSVTSTQVLCFFPVLDIGNLIRKALSHNERQVLSNLVRMKEKWMTDLMIP